VLVASITAGDAAVIAAVLAAASHLIPWIGKLLTKRRLAAERLSLQAIRQDADRLDNSYHRLEAENSRLWNRVNSLETALSIERDSHEETRERCNQLERALRRAGIPIPPNENGPPR